MSQDCRCYPLENPEIGQKILICTNVGVKIKTVIKSISMDGDCICITFSPGIWQAGTDQAKKIELAQRYKDQKWFVLIPDFGKNEAGIYLIP